MKALICAILSAALFVGAISPPAFAAYVTPSTRSTGTVITSAIWNQDVVDNMIAVRAAVLDLVVNETPATDMSLSPTGDELVLVANKTFRITGGSADPANVGGFNYDTDTKSVTWKEDIGVVGSAKLLSATTSDSTPIANTTSTTEFSQTVTIPANALQAGKVIRVTVDMIYSITGSPTCQVRLKSHSSGTVLADSGAGNGLGTGGSNRLCRLQTDITVRSVVSTTCTVVTGSVLYSFFNQIFPFCSAGGVTFDSTVSRALTVDWTWSAASVSNTVKIQRMTVEVLN